MSTPELLLEGAQCGCHGPSEVLASLKRELRQCGETVPYTQNKLFSKIPLTKPAKTPQSTTADQIGALSGEISVMSARRELQRLENEHIDAKQRLRHQQQLKVSLQLLQAEREGCEKMLETEQHHAFKEMLALAEDSLLLVASCEKVRRHSERTKEKTEAHAYDEALWYYNESHREIFERAHAKVANEFEQQQNLLNNQEARRQMQQSAIDRIFRSDSNVFKADAAQLRRASAEPPPTPILPG